MDIEKELKEALETHNRRTGPIDDNIQNDFSLGFDDVTNIVINLEATFGIKLPLPDIAKHLSLRDLIHLLKATLQEE